MFAYPFLCLVDAERAVEIVKVNSELMSIMPLIMQKKKQKSILSILRIMLRK